MKNKILLKYIYFLAFLTISINIFYTYELFGEFIKTDIENNYKETLISAIALEVSWIVIFIWFVFEPIQRKEILLITTIPMIIGNLLHNHTLEVLNFIVNILFLFLFLSLYFIGYFLLKKYELNMQKNHAN